MGKHFGDGLRIRAIMLGSWLPANAVAENVNKYIEDVLMCLMREESKAM